LFLAHSVLGVLCLWAIWAPCPVTITAKRVWETECQANWPLVFAVLRNIFVLTCIIIVCSLLFPVLWHLWIYAGSANSNFFYAITLTFNVGQVRVEGRTGSGCHFESQAISWGPGFPPCSFDYAGVCGVAVPLPLISLG
jgi:hypothetical protein